MLDSRDPDGAPERAVVVVEEVGPQARPAATAVPCPEVREKLLGNGHSPLLGSGSAGSGAVAAAGTPLGRPGIPGTLSASARALLIASALEGASATAPVTAAAPNAASRRRDLIARRVDRVPTTLPMPAMTLPMPAIRSSIFVCLHKASACSPRRIAAHAASAGTYPPP